MIIEVTGVFDREPVVPIKIGIREVAKSPHPSGERIPVREMALDWTMQTSMRGYGINE